MTNYRKKLIEVALPLAAINKASAREKSIRHGHPSTLHLWWARRPLVADASERVTPDEEGTFTIEAVHMPTNASGILELADGFDAKYKDCCRNLLGATTKLAETVVVP